MASLLDGEAMIYFLEAKLEKGETMPPRLIGHPEQVFWARIAPLSVALSFFKLSSCSVMTSEKLLSSFVAKSWRNGKRSMTIPTPMSQRSNISLDSSCCQRDRLLVLKNSSRAPLYSFEKNVGDSCPSVASALTTLGRISC